MTWRSCSGVSLVTIDPTSSSDVTVTRSAESWRATARKLSVSREPRASTFLLIASRTVRAGGATGATFVSMITVLRSLASPHSANFLSASSTCTARSVSRHSARSDRRAPKAKLLILFGLFETRERSGDLGAKPPNSTQRRAGRCGTVVSSGIGRSWPCHAPRWTELFPTRAVGAASEHLIWGKSGARSANEWGHLRSSNAGRKVRYCCFQLAGTTRRQAPSRRRCLAVARRHACS